MTRLLIVAAAALTFASAAHAQPNVLLIVTDDQRWDTLRYMPTVQSELVAKGVSFRNAFAVNPLCCPSRASIFTGTWSHTNGVWSNLGENVGGFATFDDSFALPVWLDAVGYETMLAGKYLNGYDERFTPASYVPPGWDHWSAYWGTPAMSYFDYYIARDGHPVWHGRDPESYATDVTAEEATRFIRGSGPDPFFLYFAPKAPHWSGNNQLSVDPAPRHEDAFAGTGVLRAPNVNEQDVSDKPRYIRSRPLVSTERLAELREEQLESLLAVDEAIANMLAALEETGKLADTLIVFTSDHGQSWGEHRWYTKAVPYEESLRVPMVVRYDRLGHGRRTDSRFALNVDLAPTVAAAAGMKVRGVEGRNLLPLLMGEPARWRHSFLFELGVGSPPAFCGFRSQRWKYVQYATGEEELYNLARDPHELRSKHRAYRANVMLYRTRVIRSACRPPGFRPLPQCTKTGTRYGDRIRGTRKRDWICAARGRDRINVRRGGIDIVRCGSGFDRVRADRRDILLGCERRGRRLQLR